MTWAGQAILPNLALQGPISARSIALVPIDDPFLRVGANLAAWRDFARRFTDQCGRRIECSVLIAQPHKLRRGSGIAFRNAIALSAICRGWRRQRTQRYGIWAPKYADQFAIHPYVLSDDVSRLVVSTPALRGIDDKARFRGQSFPGIPHLRLAPWDSDEWLQTALLKLWEGRFHRGSKVERTSERVFRSLEIAFRAAGVPSTSGGSIHDFGTCLALWVSAIEVLLHSGQQSISVGRVVDEFERFASFSRVLAARRYRIGSKKNPRSVGRVSAAYVRLYGARNAFLHGNDVARSSLFGGAHGLLTSLGPVLFGAALCSRLGVSAQKPVGGMKSAMWQIEWEDAFDGAER
jgi:hypothetical protein